MNVEVKKQLLEKKNLIYFYGIFSFLILVNWE